MEDQEYIIDDIVKKEVNETKKARGRPKQYTPEELKERKKQYDMSYYKKRYHDDPEFRRKEKDRMVEKYNSNKRK